MHILNLYHMFLTGESFDPKDYGKATAPEPEQVTVKVKYEPGQSSFTARTQARLELIKNNHIDLGTPEDELIKDLLKQMEEALAQKASRTSHTGNK